MFTANINRCVTPDNTMYNWPFHSSAASMAHAPRTTARSKYGISASSWEKFLHTDVTFVLRWYGSQCSDSHVDKMDMYWHLASNAVFPAFRLCTSAVGQLIYYWAYIHRWVGSDAYDMGITLHSITFTYLPITIKVQIFTYLDWLNQ